MVLQSGCVGHALETYLLEFFLSEQKQNLLVFKNTEKYNKIKSTCNTLSNNHSLSLLSSFPYGFCSAFLHSGGHTVQYIYLCVMLCSHNIRL